ncbi:Anoctamin-9 [Bagarius yarrelli]|uniref:Anoctamin n=1 Tax=Bagarius yarrelli TaxID=175774 RepID=A0A556U442_BAGYA|nr:Anoctamin-9 [Bagarius yarrelli]
MGIFYVNIGYELYLLGSCTSEASKQSRKFKIADEDKVFYGIKAPKGIFETYRYLLKVSDACNWSCEQQGSIPQSTRIRIVDYILHHTSIETAGFPEYLSDLIKQNVFQAQFCLHEKEEQKELRKTWARWTACFKGQPIADVRHYFGEKVALYFLWLGWYTFLLIPAALLGLIVFLYGLFLFNSNPLIQEVCESDVIMCPLCDKRCKVWRLSDTCTYAKVSTLFDNEGTVAFAMFMAVWATVFLEFWKLHTASYVCEWKVFDWCEEEEELILEIVNNRNCKSTKYSHSYLRNTIIMVLVTLMLLLIIGLAQAIVVFRVIASVELAKYKKWPFLSENSSTVAFILGAVLHFLTITIMTRINRKVALKLCELEKGRSHAAVERSFTVKMFIFQFFTLFSSLIYTAFFLGRINGHPGGYVRIAGIWRLEECHPSGCLTDLFIQMAIIMLLKQFFRNMFEFSSPWFSRWLKRQKSRKLKRVRQCSEKNCMEGKLGANMCDNCKLKDLLWNFDLNNVDPFSLFNEFLEIVLQFSFTTIFVAAFPLAPLLALLNNIIEIRMDAIKMVSLEQRLVPRKAKDIGVWTNVLETIGVLAVIANGLVIGISSDFIPRLVYHYRYGPCANSTTSYINNTLSMADTNKENIRKDFLPQQLIHNGMNVTHCSYRDYRNNDDYTLTNQFWVIQAVRFAFVVIFEDSTMGHMSLLVCVIWIQFALVIGEPLCSGSLRFVPSSTEKDVWRDLGSSAELNCTVLLHYSNKSATECKAHLQWSKDGEALLSTDSFTQNFSQWFTDDEQLMLSSVLTVSLKEKSEFGIYSCNLWNSTTIFRLQCSNFHSHTGAMLASLVLFIMLILLAVVYTKCHLNLKLWYKNSYGEYEINDGKIYDAYISYINDENDQKFVNFILKSHLETKYGHKLLLNNTNILPGAEPSAELVMNISRCRRLIVVLSQAYLQQEWCTTNFRQGLYHLLELSQKPIFIVFQSQQKHVSVSIIQHLRDHQARITTLVWGAHSIAPSSGFWKSLAIAMPRKVMFHRQLSGDPQTLLQEDSDPMLSLQPDYLDCRPDPDPAGDLGLRFPIYKAMSRDQPLPPASDPVHEAKITEIDVSDLGSRSYAARTDFYCLVTDDI